MADCAEIEGGQRDEAAAGGDAFVENADDPDRKIGACEPAISPAKTVDASRSASGSRPSARTACGAAPAARSLSPARVRARNQRSQRHQQPGRPGQRVVAGQQRAEDRACRQ